MCGVIESRRAFLRFDLITQSHDPANSKQDICQHYARFSAENKSTKLPKCHRPHYSECSVTSQASKLHTGRLSLTYQVLFKCEDFIKIFKDRQMPADAETCLSQQRSSHPPIESHTTLRPRKSFTMAI